MNYPDPVTAAAATSAAIVATKGMDLICDLLRRICRPGADEIGLAIKDMATTYRLKNLEEVVKRAQSLMDRLAVDSQAHPRTVLTIFDKASWTDDSDLQDMWAGLLASSCNPNGKEDVNLIYAHLLDNLTGGQARVLSFSVQNGRRSYSPAGGWATASPVSYPTHELVALSGAEDVNQLDAALDHLNVIGLVRGGFPVYSLDAPNVTLETTSLGLNLYIRCQGSKKTPREYFAPIDRQRKADEAALKDSASSEPTS